MFIIRTQNGTSVRYLKATGGWVTYRDNASRFPRLATAELLAMSFENIKGRGWITTIERIEDED